MKARELLCVLITGLFLGLIAHEGFHWFGGGQAICLGQASNPSLVMPLGSLMFVTAGPNFNSFFGDELIALGITISVMVVFFVAYYRLGGKSI